MTWFEAIIDGIRFIFEELLAPVYDWLELHFKKLLEDFLYWCLIFIIFSIAIVIFFNPIVVPAFLLKT